MTRFRSILAVAVVLGMTPSLLAHDFNWHTLCLAYIKLDKGFDYPAHAKSYLMAFEGKAWAQVRDNEFRRRKALEGATEKLQQAVQGFSLDEEFLISTELKFGEYDAERKGFPVREMTADWFWYATRSSDHRGLFPEKFEVFLTNPEVLALISMDEKQAEGLLEKRRDQGGEINRKFPAHLKVRIVRTRIPKHKFFAEIQSAKVYSDVRGGKVLYELTLPKGQGTEPRKPEPQQQPRTPSLSSAAAPKPLRTVQLPTGKTLTSRAEFLHFLPDGGTLVIGNQVVSRSKDKGAESGDRIPAHIREDLFGEGPERLRVPALTFLDVASGKRLKEIWPLRVLDLQTHGPLRREQYDRFLVSGDAESVYCLARFNNGKRGSLSYQQDLVFSIAVRNKLPAKLVSREPDVLQEIALSPDGKRLAYSVKSGEVTLADLVVQQKPFSFGGEGEATSLAFSPDGNHLVMGWVVYDSRSGERLLSPKDHPWPSISGGVRFTCDGKALVSVGTDGNLHVWELGSETVRKVACPAAGRVLRPRSF